MGFRSFLTGTIRRKPPLEPKLPMLTSFPGELSPSPHTMPEYQLALPKAFSSVFAASTSDRNILKIKTVASSRPFRDGYALVLFEACLPPSKG